MRTCSVELTCLHLISCNKLIATIQKERMNFSLLLLLLYISDHNRTKLKDL